MSASEATDELSERVDGDVCAGAAVGALGGDTPEAWAARLTAHHHRRRTLFEWMHPQRLADVPCVNRLPTCGAARKAQLADAFLDALGMPAPPLDAFRAPGAALALLPAPECLSVFRLRALAEHTEQLRAWIDRPRRTLLAEWIGARGVSLLLGRGRGLAGDARQLATRSRHAAPGRAAGLDAADGDTLAWLGFRLFERECRWAVDGPLALMQLALAPGMDTAAPLSERAREEGPNASLSIVSQLPDLFPEWSW
ncbi:hypothetical protein C0Z18_04335 [Trinickia dabaoshanensis]|uniref:Type III secretion protein n=1 Tax=Trinickia dabaoshanensis TaxID=564714 RepID=A0A2N7VZG6_9BURK|nr:type III secretion protein HrpB4 [Trinickia dabaoshanensis]PMS22559.1 hypothetical protein C0Z18_04335 [Trinickia dabaoshanensis]